MVAHISSAVAATMNGMLSVNAAYLGKRWANQQELSASLNGERQITEVAVLNPRFDGFAIAVGSITLTAMPTRPRS